jgi:hypothetical protein
MKAAPIGREGARVLHLVCEDMHNLETAFTAIKPMCLFPTRFLCDVRA